MLKTALGTHYVRTLLNLASLDSRGSFRIILFVIFKGKSKNGFAPHIKIFTRYARSWNNSVYCRLALYISLRFKREYVIREKTVTNFYMAQSLVDTRSVLAVILFLISRLIFYANLVTIILRI